MTVLEIQLAVGSMDNGCKGVFPLLQFACTSLWFVEVAFLIFYCFKFSFIQKERIYIQVKGSIVADPGGGTTGTPPQKKKKTDRQCFLF